MFSVLLITMLMAFSPFNGVLGEEDSQFLIPHPTAAYHKFNFGTVKCRTHSNGYQEIVHHDQILKKTQEGNGVPVLGLNLRNTLYKVNLGHDEKGEEDILGYFRILPSEKKENAEKLVFLYLSTEYVSLALRCKTIANAAGYL